MSILKTTPKDVLNLIDTERDPTPFIEVAQLLVDELLGPYPNSSSGLSPDRLNAIVRYLATHLVWLSETQGLVQSEIAGAREVYRTFSDKSTGLSVSRYGETALVLDTTGTLARKTANNGMKALFNVIPCRGNPPIWVTNTSPDTPDPIWWP